MLYYSIHLTSSSTSSIHTAVETSQALRGLRFALLVRRLAHQPQGAVRRLAAAQPEGGARLPGKMDKHREIHGETWGKHRENIGKTWKKGGEQLSHLMSAAETVARQVISEKLCGMVPESEDGSFSNPWNTPFLYHKNHEIGMDRKT